MTETSKPLPVPSPSTDAAYHPDAVEAKWQARWAERGTNEPDLDRAARPFYNLMMFPYPSAEGLHVGNMFAFTGADVYGRFKRLQGYDVFEPIGFDAFGIHSENYAIKQGINPADPDPAEHRELPPPARADRRDVRLAARALDHRPALLQVDPVDLPPALKAGKAYKKAAAVNWCPKDKTVLANEQVIDGRCERCGTAVEQRMLEQWFFRITEYADRLLADLDDSPRWTGRTAPRRRSATGWGGREGAEIGLPGRRTGGTADRRTDGRVAAIRVYTTRPDTVFGATFMVLAPEHPLVDALTTPEQRAAVEAYRQAAARRTWCPARWATGRRPACSPAATR